MGTPDDELSLIKDRVLRRLLTMFSFASLAVIAIFLLQGQLGMFRLRRALLPSTSPPASGPSRAP